MGSVSKRRFTSRTIYPDVERDYWVYVPRQYEPDRPARLMVFQDGEQYLSGPYVHAATVLDNLIAKNEIPVIIAVFVNPGEQGPGNPVYGGANNRSLEYDSLGDAYVRFLLEELLPEVEREYNLTRDPAGRAICGMSSGGLAAFNAAWERPDAFGKVVCHCGAFVNIRGGHVFPSRIRQATRKPIRVLLQSGVHDCDTIYGNWAIANQDLAAALRYAEYDYEFIFGDSAHSLQHGGAIFPNTLRWLWRATPIDLPATR